MPGVLLTETMAQASGFLVLGLMDFTHMPFLMAVDKARFRTFVGPGAEARRRGAIRARGLRLRGHQGEDRGRRQAHLRRGPALQDHAVPRRARQRPCAARPPDRAVRGRGLMREVVITDRPRLLRRRGRRCASRRPRERRRAATRRPPSRPIRSTRSSRSITTSRSRRNPISGRWSPGSGSAATPPGSPSTPPAPRATRR